MAAQETQHGKTLGLAIQQMEDARTSERSAIKYTRAATGIAAVSAFIAFLSWHDQHSTGEIARKESTEIQDRVTELSKRLFALEHPVTDAAPIINQPAPQAPVVQPAPQSSDAAKKSD